MMHKTCVQSVLLKTMNLQAMRVQEIRESQTCSFSVKEPQGHHLSLLF